MRASIYSIRIQGHLDLNWSTWFGDLTITHDPKGETTLIGPVRDQAALQGILNRMFELNLTLIAVNRVEETATAAPGPLDLEPVVVGLDNSTGVNHT